MALINKTAVDTLSRLGPACIPDLMELFAPMDKTREGTMLLTLAANATKDAANVPFMIELGYKIQPELLAHCVAEDVLAAAMRGRTLADFGSLCHPNKGSTAALLDMPPCSTVRSLFSQAMAEAPFIEAKACRQIFESSFANRLRSEEVDEEDAARHQIGECVVHAKSMLFSLASNPNSEPAGFDFMASQLCFDLIETTLVYPCVNLERSSRSKQSKAWIELLLKEACLQSSKDLHSTSSVAQAISLSWQAQCHALVIKAASETGPMSTKVPSNRL